MPDDIAPGRVLGGRYVLRRQLARGGMAAVWEGEDSILARRVAVKILDARLGEDAALRARFSREAIAAAQLSHPGIVATYDTGDDDGIAYIVMELVDGVTLRNALDDAGRLEPARAADVAGQVADALAHAHSHGLVHRDIKPGNVLLHPDGRVKVTDFGIAKAAGFDDLTRSGAVVGTARYLAPEQLDGRPVDARADVYSLGLVLYETLAGAPAYSGDTEVAAALARLATDPPPLASLRPGLPDGLLGAVAHATARDPDGRYPTAAAFRDALAPLRADEPRVDPTIADAFADSTHIATPPTTTAGAPPGPAAARSRHTSLVAVSVALGVLVAGVLAWRALDRGGSDPPASAPAVVDLPVEGVADFDPEGDGAEHPELVVNAIDRDPGTAWRTETYATRDLGGGKPGVGLRLDLGGPKSVQVVAVDTAESGWSAEIYVGDEPHSALPAWGEPVAEGADLPPAHRFELAAPVAGSFVLVWFTNLPPEGRLFVGEVRVEGSGAA